MPKKYSITDNRKWLGKHEDGKSEAWIANRYKIDIRTISRGIDDARRNRDAQTARIELIKQALLKHQDNLLDKLKGILSALTMPPKDEAILSWHQNADSIFSDGKSDTENANMQKQGFTKMPKDSDIPVDMVQDILRQHLKNDKVWKLLAKREKVHVSHRLEKIAFQRKVVSLLEEETGYNLMGNNDAPPPFLYSYTTGALFYEKTIHRAFSDYEDDTWQGDIVVDTDAGYVKYRNMILAEVPGKAKECRKMLLNAFHKIQLLPGIIRVVDTYKELEQATLRAKQMLEEILMLGLIPGHCKICRRLGI